MKIEIDLNEILGDESGVETLQESVRRQVVEKIQREMADGIKQRIDREVALAIDESIRTSLKEITPKLLNDLMDAEYTPVDRWGDRQSGKTTTFRKQLVASIHEQMVYKKTTFDSDKSPFTKAVDETVSANVAVFKTQFSNLVNDQFTEECLKYAVQKLKERLKV